MLLGVNIDHVATLRNARGGFEPDVLTAARICKSCGVESITTHVGGCASNAAIDLAKLGVPVVFSGKTGKDSFGSFV